LSDSPARLAGTSSGYITDILGNLVTTPPDIGAYQFIVIAPISASTIEKRSHKSGFGTLAGSIEAPMFLTLGNIPITLENAVGMLEIKSGSTYLQVRTTELFIGNGNISISAGSSSPENVVSKSIGSIFLRTDGGTNTTLYIKETGNGTIGWSAK
jgi:hypothetical protein